MNSDPSTPIRPPVIHCWICLLIAGLLIGCGPSINALRTALPISGVQALANHSQLVIANNQPYLVKDAWVTKVPLCKDNGDGCDVRDSSISPDGKQIAV